MAVVADCWVVGDETAVVAVLAPEVVEPGVLLAVEFVLGAAGGITELLEAIALEENRVVEVMLPLAVPCFKDASRLAVEVEESLVGIRSTTTSRPPKRTKTATILMSMELMLLKNQFDEDDEVEL